MKTSAQLLVIRLIGTAAIGTLFLVFGAFLAAMERGVFERVFDLPRLVVLAIFYGGAYLVLEFFKPASTP